MVGEVKEAAEELNVDYSARSRYSDKVIAGGSCYTFVDKSITGSNHKGYANSPHISRGLKSRHTMKNCGYLSNFLNRKSGYSVSKYSTKKVDLFINVASR